MIPISKEELDMNPHNPTPRQKAIITDIQEPDKPVMYEFTIDELRALYSLLHKEWISYENLDAIKVVHKIRMIVENDEQ